MRRWILPCIAVVASAQPALPATADQEPAVRERAQQFLQFEVDKKFRQAEAMVAEASKDFFYNGAKPAVNSFRIDSVDFPDDKTAHVKIHATFLIVIPGVPPQNFELASTQTWKLEDGQWMYFIDTDALRQTPFGKVPEPVGNSPQTALPGIPGIPGAIAPNSATTANIVTLDRKSVALTTEAPEQTVIVRNGLPGPVDMKVIESSPHLDVRMASLHLNAGDKGQISIQWKDRVTGIWHVRIVVAPIGQQLDIEVTAK